MVRCKYIKSDGNQCKKECRIASDFCSVHYSKNKDEIRNSDTESVGDTIDEDQMKLDDANILQDLKMSNDFIIEAIKVLKTDTDYMRTHVISSIKEDIANLAKSFQLLHVEARNCNCNKLDKKDNKVSQKAIERRAKMLFYHEYKQKDEFTSFIRTGLENAKLIGKGMKVPWMNVKILSDHYYDTNLSPEQKNIYYEMAKETISG